MKSNGMTIILIKKKNKKKKENSMTTKFRSADNLILSITDSTIFPSSLEGILLTNLLQKINPNQSLTRIFW